MVIPSKEMDEEMKNITERILCLKADISTYDTSDLESEIDSLVYKLYGLTEEEIKIIEQL